MKPARNHRLMFALLISLVGLVPACKESTNVVSQPEQSSNVSVFVDTELIVTTSGQEPTTRTSSWEIYFDREAAILMLVTQRKDTSWMQLYLDGTTYAAWMMDGAKVTSSTAKVFSSEAAARNELYKRTQDVFLAIEPLFGNKTLTVDFTATSIEPNITRYEVKPEPVTPVFKMITDEGLAILGESHVDEDGFVTFYTISQKNNTTGAVVSGTVTSRETRVPSEMMTLPEAVRAKIDAALTEPN